MTVKLVWVTPDAEHHVAYCARVSNPSNQDNRETEARLLKYCLKHGHWSPFEMASMCVEINTSRAIARQILRHRSFGFQEFSQRYAEVTDDYIQVHARAQDTKNRQASHDTLDQNIKDGFECAQTRVWRQAMKDYKYALSVGIAKECARALLPEGLTPSRMYMTGNLRSWLHYLQVRLDLSTQLEHRLIAEEIKEIFVTQFPVLGECLDEFLAKKD